jgi:pilus assembly protein Flp/PilA
MLYVLAMYSGMCGVSARLLSLCHPLSRKQLMTKLLKFLTRKQEGATMVEYGIMLALIAAVCIVAVALIGTKTDAMLGNLASAIGKA